jgi:cation diffusion facilitator CzcD-associated flavoprotein CzcO
LVHSANWDESIDFANKKVAVIGVGSSAIQIIPKLANGERIKQSEIGFY